MISLSVQSGRTDAVNGSSQLEESGAQSEALLGRNLTQDHPGFKNLHLGERLLPSEDQLHRIENF